MNQQDKCAKIHVHVRRGMVEKVEAEGLSERVEVIVHDYDTQDESLENKSVYKFKPEPNERR